MQILPWRMARNMSQTAFAKGIRVNQSMVARYESGERVPPPPIMARLVEFTDGAVTANDCYEAWAAYRSRKSA